MTTPRIVFAGTGAFAVPSLQALAATVNLLLVVSKSARPAGKHQTLTPSPVEHAATTLGFPLATPDHIGDVTSRLAVLEPDAVVVADYGQIIPSSLLALPRHGFLNIHPSLLPRHRGPAPVVATILSGDDETGVTIIRMDEQLDHGPIVAQERYPLTGREVAPELEIALAGQAADLLRRTLPRFLSGEIMPHEQDHTAATYHKLLRRSDGEIKWDEAAAVIERKFRAYQPWPGVWFKSNINGRIKTIKLLGLDRSDAIAPGSAPSGSLWWRKDTLYLITLEGTTLRVTKLQVAGGRSLTAEEFYRGYSGTLLLA